MTATKMMSRDEASALAARELSKGQPRPYPVLDADAMIARELHALPNGCYLESDILDMAARVQRYRLQVAANAPAYVDPDGNPHY